MAHAQTGGSIPATDRRSALRLKIIFAIARCKPNGEAVASAFVENKDTLETILEWVANLPHGFDELKDEVARAVAAAAATSGVAETAAATSPPAGVAETAAAAPLSSPENELLLTVIGAISKCKPNGQAVAERFVSNEDSLETVLAWVRGLPGRFDDLKREVEGAVAAVPSSSAHSRLPPPLPEQPAAPADTQPPKTSPTAAVFGQSGAQARQGRRRFKHTKGAQVSAVAAAAAAAQVVDLAPDDEDVTEPAAKKARLSEAAPSAPVTTSPVADEPDRSANRITPLVLGDKRLLKLAKRLLVSCRGFWLASQNVALEVLEALLGDLQYVHAAHFAVALSTATIKNMKQSIDRPPGFATIPSSRNGSSDTAWAADMAAAVRACGGGYAGLQLCRLEALAAADG